MFPTIHLVAKLPALGEDKVSASWIVVEGTIEANDWIGLFLVGVEDSYPIQRRACKDEKHGGSVRFALLIFLSYPK
jgi:hypothetical protein